MRGHDRGIQPIARRLIEVVDRQRFAVLARVVLRVGTAGSAFRGGDAPSLDKGAQNRERQIGMTSLDGLIEPIGQLTPA